MKLKSIKHVMPLIKRCDVILRNGEEQFVGLYFNKSEYDRPIVLFKCDWEFNYFLAKALELMPIPCVEQKILTKALFENTAEGYYINHSYVGAMASVYSKLNRFKYKKESFDEALNNDVVTQLYQLEANICKKAEKKFLRKKLKKENRQISVDDARELLGENMPALSEEYGMMYSGIHNASKGTDEYYLETEIEEYDFNLWLMVMLLPKDKKIYVGNRSVFMAFDVCEAERAIEYVKVLIQACNGKLREEGKIFCEEFRLNTRLYDIAKNSIKTLLEMHFRRTGNEYGIDDSKKTHVMVYLKDSTDASKMYEVCITYNEFLRNPDAFKKMIEEPKAFTKWNFWACRKKYREEFFEEEFCKD